MSVEHIGEDTENANTENGNGGRAPALSSIPVRKSQTRWGRRRPLWRAVGGHQARLANHGLGAGGTQAGRLEIRPGLLGAVAAKRADVEPVGFRQRLRYAGFDL